MEVTTVKAEIKQWEYEFREQHGRIATVDDIKAVPRVAEMYKLYKKLIKEVDRNKVKIKASQTCVPDPPRTPPPASKRIQLSSSDVSSAPIFHKPRPITSPPNTTSHNPFSPMKKKTQSSSAKPSTGINPFLTPIKRKRTPSPEHIPDVREDSLLATQQNAAVAKARRRLRGESVSPSPKSRKKRRCANGLDPPAYVTPSKARSVSPLDEEEEEEEGFMNDSPTKHPVGGKRFMPIFEEALSQPTHSKGGDTAIRQRKLSRAKTLPNALFASTEDRRIQGGRGTPDAAPRLFANESTKGVHTGMNGTGTDNNKEDEKGAQRVKRVLPGPKGLIPQTDDIFDAVTSGREGSRKRTISNVTADRHPDKHPGRNKSGVLPSRLQRDDARQYNIKETEKWRAKNTTRTRNKKAKLSVDEDEDAINDTSSSDGVDVKTVTWRAHPPQQERGELGWVIDPELRPFHVRSRTIDIAARSASQGQERFEVDLPEEMRRVLAISPRDVGREREAEFIVKGLLQGRRGVGCQVWGPGEVGGESESSDEGIPRGAEDDWESEGVLWEVAEL